MPRFPFPLQSLLVVRRQQREHQRVLLARVLAEEGELETRRTLVERELHDGRHRAHSGAAPGRIDVARLATAGRYEASLRDDLTALAVEQQALGHEIASRRGAVVEADREVQKLEKLRDRHHEQRRVEQSRAETKELDEVSAQRVHRPPII